MKRTQHINKNSFRKSWRLYRLTPLAIAISSVFLLSSCEKTDENVAKYQQDVTIYKNAEACSTANPALAKECDAAFSQAKQEAERTSPKYSSEADCIAEFGADQCVPFEAAAQKENNPNQVQQASTSSWMPLLAGFMFGRMMSGFAHQPVFSPQSAASPARGNFVDASGKNYGKATYGKTMKVDPSSLAPKPTKTTTTTRGGFGQMIKQQQAITNKSTTRSSGG